MSALQGNGEEVERERKRESEMERGCGGEDGRAEGRQPVAPDHNNPPPVLQLGAGAVDGWSRVKWGGSRSWALAAFFSPPVFSMCIFPSASSKTNSCRGADSGTQWVFLFYTFYTYTYFVLPPFLWIFTQNSKTKTHQLLTFLTKHEAI